MSILDKAKIGSSVQVNLELSKDRLTKETIDAINVSSLGKISDFRITDGKGIGVVLQLSNGKEQWFFEDEIDILDENGNVIKKNIDKKENPKEYLSGFLQGTRSALSSEDRQSITITLEKLNCFSLGGLIALFERAVSFYAELVNINAYDQPGVEAGKKAAANIIEYQQKVSNLLDEGGEYSIKDITSLFDKSASEPIFFILREMCFSNDNYLVKGDWSNPNSLVIQKINS